MSTGDQVIRIVGLTKAYSQGEMQVQALDGVGFTVARGEFVAIMGPSGCGKSTLLNIIGCLDRPTGGLYELDGVRPYTLPASQLARVRNRMIGFVFQSFHLLPGVPAVEQVELPLIYAGVGNRRALALAALERVGLTNRARHTPTELSGGQQQRVAIARAIVRRPPLLLADEPTGALDSKTSLEVMRLLIDLKRAHGLSIVMVTHDPAIAGWADRVIHMSDGRIVRVEVPGPPAAA
jgi:putative ABC transport system ATP-binding protein